MTKQTDLSIRFCWRPQRWHCFHSYHWHFLKPLTIFPRALLCLDVLLLVGLHKGKVTCVQMALTSFATCPSVRTWHFSNDPTMIQQTSKHDPSWPPVSNLLQLIPGNHPAGSTHPSWHWVSVAADVLQANPQNPNSKSFSLNVEPGEWWQPTYK